MRDFDGQPSHPRDPEASLPQLPIIVDLDGTLLLTDTLVEMGVVALFRKPVALVRAVIALPQGRHAMKAALAQDVDLSKIALPFREDLVEWLRQKAGEGHDLHLVSAADQTVVDEIAGRLGLFTSAVGSDGTNLKGDRKAAYLCAQYPDGFIYVGDNDVDLAVWSRSSGIVLAGTSTGVAVRAAALGKPVIHRFENAPLELKDAVKAVRVHHWSKNVLMFVPLILAHQWYNAPLIRATFLGFLCLLAVTSGTYLLNDIADLNADRSHWSKKTRALASGRLPIAAGLAMAVALVAGGLRGALVISPHLFLAILAYCVITLAYSLGLKRIPLLDTLIIGILFASRLVMGAVLIEHTKPAWLLSFAVFFFFSMANAKRHTEIVRAAKEGAASIRSRGYELEDAPLTLALGVSSAVASLVVLILFILQAMLPGQAYSRPALLSGIPIVLAIWMGRIWFLSHRGRMNDDPVSFALRDRTSMILFAAVAVLFMVSL